MLDLWWFHSLGIPISWILQNNGFQTIRLKRILLHTEWILFVESSWLTSRMLKILLLKSFRTFLLHQNQLTVRQPLDQSLLVQASMKKSHLMVQVLLLKSLTLMLSDGISSLKRAFMILTWRQEMQWWIFTIRMFHFLQCKKRSL